MEGPIARVALGATLVTLIGAIDDLRSQRPLGKLAIQIAAALVVIAGGTVIDAVGRFTSVRSGSRSRSSGSSVSPTRST